ncbi:phage tail assembly protein T [Hydrocarboniphaga effusa]|uniref:phage tail assembly protein T n=1 Tax=Hydrocarboniphaga effusa TaxID=243629 RepID=UPI003BA85BA6
MGYPMRVLSRLMTYAEFLDWAREFAREPFDDRRCFDRPAAEIRHLYVNSHRKQGAPVIPLERFMPYRDVESIPEPVNIDAQILAKL